MAQYLLSKNNEPFDKFYKNLFQLFHQESETVNVF